MDLKAGGRALRVQHHLTGWVDQAHVHGGIQSLLDPLVHARPNRSVQEPTSHALGRQLKDTRGALQAPSHMRLVDLE